MYSPPRRKTYRNNKRHCGNKDRFDTYMGAKRFLNQYLASHPDEADYRKGGMIVYQCQTCNGFHIGHHTDRIVQQERAAQKKWDRLRTSVVGY